MKIISQVSFLGLAALTVCGSALAGVPCAQKWVGTGTAYAPDGSEQGSYQVEVLNEEAANHDVVSTRTITLPDGKTEVFSMKIVEREHGFTVESSFGSGGGNCYGGDLCEIYLSNQKAGAIAITSIKDGTDARRHLVFVLQDGKPTRIFREKLSLVQ